MESIQARINQGSDPQGVSRDCSGLIEDLVLAGGLARSPHRAPDLAHGKEVYAKACAACHAQDGSGHVAIAATMQPKPANFLDAEVMAAARRHGMVTMPGVFTPTEAFLALRLGASALKFFPASVLGTGGITAMKAVLPADTIAGAVGGVSEKDFAGYKAAGVSAFGLGSSLFKPGMSVDDIAGRARAAAAAWDATFGAA